VGDSDTGAARVNEDVRTAGAAIGEAVSVFMVHPETVEQGMAAGYPDPFAAYFAGRGGVLGEATPETVSAVFVVFDPDFVRTCWENGLAVRSAAASASLYWDQAADFGRRHLTGVEGLDRIAEIGEKIIAAAPDPGLPLFAGWRRMPLADDAPARALQVMFILRELRASVHFNALALSGVSPVEAHILSKGPDYAAFMGWRKPYPDGAGKQKRLAEAEVTTNRRMAEIINAAVTDDELAELAQLSVGARACVKGKTPDQLGDGSASASVR